MKKSIVLFLLVLSMLVATRAHAQFQDSIYVFDLGGRPVKMTGNFEVVSPDSTTRYLFESFFQKDVVIVKSSLLIADLNGDDRVDFVDFLLFVQDFGKTNLDGVFTADFNRDGLINFADFLLFASNFGKQASLFEKQVKINVTSTDAIVLENFSLLKTLSANVPSVDSVYVRTNKNFRQVLNLQLRKGETILDSNSILEPGDHVSASASVSVFSDTGSVALRTYPVPDSTLKISASGVMQYSDGVLSVTGFGDGAITAQYDTLTATFAVRVAQPITASLRIGLSHPQIEVGDRVTVYVFKFLTQEDSVISQTRVFPDSLHGAGQDGSFILIGDTLVVFKPDSIGLTAFFEELVFDTTLVSNPSSRPKVDLSINEGKLSFIADTTGVGKPLVSILVNESYIIVPGFADTVASIGSLQNMPISGNYIRTEGLNTVQLHAINTRTGRDTIIVRRDSVDTVGPKYHAVPDSVTWNKGSYEALVIITDFSGLATWSANLVRLDGDRFVVVGSFGDTPRPTTRTITAEATDSKGNGTSISFDVTQPITQTQSSGGGDSGGSSGGDSGSGGDNNPVDVTPTPQPLSNISFSDNIPASPKAGDVATFNVTGSNIASVTWYVNNASVAAGASYARTLTTGLQVIRVVVVGVAGDTHTPEKSWSINVLGGFGF